MQTEVVAANLTPLGSAITRWLDGLPWLEAVASIVLILLTAIVITRLISRNLVFPARTYVFLIFLAIIGYGIFIRSGNFTAILSAFLLARASECFAAAFRRTANMYDSFRGALMLGLAPMFYAPATIYIILLPIATLVYMRGWRETVVGFAGLALPILTYSYIRWTSGRPFTEYFTDLYAQLTTPTIGVSFIDTTSTVGIARMVLISIVAAGVVVSLWTHIRNAGMIRTRAFRIYLYMICFMLVAIGGIMLPCASVGDMPLIALPVSVVASEYFSRYTGTIASIIYISMTLVAMSYNILLIL
jgi:hypothetical protein